MISAPAPNNIGTIKNPTPEAASPSAYIAIAPFAIASQLIFPNELIPLDIPSNASPNNLKLYAMRTIVTPRASKIPIAGNITSEPAVNNAPTITTAAAVPINAAAITFQSIPFNNDNPYATTPNAAAIITIPAAPLSAPDVPNDATPRLIPFNIPSAPLPIPCPSDFNPLPIPPIAELIILVPPDVDGNVLLTNVLDAPNTPRPGISAAALDKASDNFCLFNINKYTAAAVDINPSMTFNGPGKSLSVSENESIYPDHLSNIPVIGPIASAIISNIFPIGDNKAPIPLSITPTIFNNGTRIMVNTLTIGVNTFATSMKILFIMFPRFVMTPCI